MFGSNPFMSLWWNIAGGLTSCLGKFDEIISEKRLMPLLEPCLSSY